MDLSERRARLEALATTAESDSVRMRAFLLLAELDERAEREPVATFDPDAYAREMAEDEERLTRLVELADECGLLAALPGYEQHVEARARELVHEQAERYRAQIAEASSSSPDCNPKRPADDDKRSAERPSRALRGPAEGNRSEEEPEPEGAREKADPLSPQVLARQWPRGQRSMITRWRERP
jgi:hypothetical protein